MDALPNMLWLWVLGSKHAFCSILPACVLPIHELFMYSPLKSIKIWLLTSGFASIRLSTSSHLFSSWRWWVQSVQCTVLNFFTLKNWINIKFILYSVKSRCLRRIGPVQCTYHFLLFILSLCIPSNQFIVLLYELLFYCTNPCLFPTVRGSLLWQRLLNPSSFPLTHCKALECLRLFVNRRFPLLVVYSSKVQA